MLPPTIPGKPFVGSLLQMRADPIDMFMRASRLGDVVHMHFPGKDAVLVHRPDDIKTVLIDEHRSFGKSTRGYNALRVGLGQGLITSEGSFWRRQRRIAQPAFHKRRVAGFADKMIRATVAASLSWVSWPASSVGLCAKRSACARRQRTRRTVIRQNRLIMF